MFCSNCGTACDDGAKFCPACGNNMAAESAQPVYQQPEQPAQPVYQQPVYQQPVYQQPVYQQPVYQQPVYQQPAKKPGKGQGIASMVLGILSLLMLMSNESGVGVVLSIPGLILGAVGISMAKKVKASNGMAVAGLVCSIITLAIFTLVLIFAVSVVSSVDSWY